MTKRKLLLIAVATVGLAISLPSQAAYKCITKNGITYQGTPCLEASPQDDSGQRAGDSGNARFAHSASREPEAPRPQDRERLAAERRKAEEADQYREWLERAARKADAIRQCAALAVKCDVNALRSMAQYLSESQLEQALGGPGQKQLMGLENSSYWTVRINDTGRRIQVVKMAAAWGYCSDDKEYFGSGRGERACKVTVE